MPKDFVFVDLSPVKTYESDSDGDSEKVASIMSTPNGSPTLTCSDDSLSTDQALFDMDTTDFFNQICAHDASAMQDNAGYFSNCGLGLMDGWDGSQVFDQQVYHTSFETPRQMAEAQFQTPLDKIITSPTLEKCHKRSKSMADIPKKKPAFQFKTYRAPKSKDVKIKKTTKPILRHRHTISEPIDLKQITIVKRTPDQKQGLDDFMKLSEQLEVSLKDSILKENGTPFTDLDLSEYEEELLRKPLKVDPSLINCGIDQFLLQKQDEFDFSAFVAL